MALISRRLSMKWQADRPDINDLKFSHHFTIDKTKWKKLTTNIEKCPPVEDQGQLGSCTANSLAGHIIYLNPDLKMVSRLFIYWNERFLENTVGADSGAQLRDGILTLAKWGVCEESQWPYDIAKFKVKPSQACYESARKELISKFYRIESADELKQCLNDGFIASYGFTCYDSFEGDLAAQTGFVPLPNPGENAVGGHAVCVIDYGTAGDFMDADALAANGIEASLDVFLVRNSYGTDWGLKKYPGYFVTPQAYLENSDLASDFWTIRK